MTQERYSIYDMCPGLELAIDSALERYNASNIKNNDLEDQTIESVMSEFKKISDEIIKSSERRRARLNKFSQ